MSERHRSAETGEFVTEEEANAHPNTTVGEQVGGFLPPRPGDVDLPVQFVDSSLDTLRHSRRVDELLLEVLTAIQSRLTKHDASKLESPEKEIFDEYSPKLGQLEYGSPEYKESLAQMTPALDHHYANNRHHPEHFANGINGMTLVDLVEMLADWRAATERNKNGSLARSLDIQQDRFDISDQLTQILENTAAEFGWLQTPVETEDDR